MGTQHDLCNKWSHTVTSNVNESIETRTISTATKRDQSGLKPGPNDCMTFTEQR